MSKTPYEIRLEVLKMAKDLLVEQVYAEREEINSRFVYLNDHQKSKQGYPELPKLPDTYDILKTALDLQKFVNNNNGE